ncbi:MULTISPECIES: Crp/Fnr family transcriptional regulator [Streptomyces]|uniref:Crp/Fnr family transcriptional regulator n=1 Tax=Streptomyces TaxID=1883 RepID=UPI0022494A04|nr:cyclic nucleotide-binding domain-containing protein [Streptomyces sp. JHD 1]MCX2968496.1 cyclic nucleotide-binding domain-containing protein [Streptomyces sp. JHD 1]
MRTMTGLLGSLPPGHSERLRALGHQVAFPAGARIFEEGTIADRFWIIHTGSVTLDQRIPGRRPQTVETVGHGELLGWSWLFRPYTWHLGAEAGSPVRALEFGAVEVRRLCEEDHELGYALALAVGEIISHRLQRSRARLLDAFGPAGSADLP